MKAFVLRSTLAGLNRCRVGSGDEIPKRRAVDASLEEAYSKSLSDVSLAAFISLDVSQN